MPPSVCNQVLTDIHKSIPKKDLKNLELVEKKIASHCKPRRGHTSQFKKLVMKPYPFFFRFHRYIFFFSATNWTLLSVLYRNPFLLAFLRLECAKNWRGITLLFAKSKTVGFVFKHKFYFRSYPLFFFFNQQLKLLVKMLTTRK